MTKKALIISPIPTHPQNAGNRARIFTFVETLKRMGIEPHLVYMARGPHADEEMTAYWGDRLTFVPTDIHFGRQQRTLTRKIIKKLKIKTSTRFKFTYSLDESFEPLLLEACRDLHHKHRFDFVISEYIFMSRAFKVFTDKTIKIIDTHDCFTDRYKGFPPGEARQAMKWISVSRRDEQKGLNRADRIIAIQENEARYFRRLTKKPILTVGHLSTEILSKPDSAIPNKKILLFATENRINLDGYFRFVKETWPRIQAAVPDCELVIAGHICRVVQPVPGAVCWGEVTDKAEVYAQAALAINPIRYGSGLKIKTIEPLIHGLPVVTTLHGAIGLEEMVGSCLFASDDPEQTADMVTRLLKDPEAYRDALTGLKASLAEYRRKNELNMEAVFAPAGSDD